MSKNIEIEVKGYLEKEQYEHIIASYNNLKPYEQINFYIDTKSFEIKENKCGLRIRKKNGKYELTLKVKQSEGQLEINQDITENDYKNMVNCGVFPDGEVKSYITDNLKIDVTKLFVFASMTTIRLDIPYNDSLVSIDKSECFGTTDYEIECESSSKQKAQDDVEKFLSQFGFEYKLFKPSKLKRAIQRYKQNNQ